MESFLRRNKSPNYNFVYDQVVSCGEMISSKIISEYLNDLQYQNDWIDARDYIKTDNTYREGAIHWDITSQKIAELDKQKCFVTQGFIGSDDNSFTVTLGREGSDYSAAIFAYCLDAVSMTIWKDVPGVMTGDPRKFENVKLLSNISYEEAIEMAYYGASVIHPKTLQPLQQKNIPFYVKSFLHPKDAGTKIGNSDINQNEESYILKDNQILLHIDTKDFSFIAEEHISEIFSYLAKYKIKVSLIQNSAISLAICIEDKYGNQNLLKQDLKSKFNIEIYENVNLFTVRNVNLENMEKFYKNKTILLEQLSKKTLQMITQS
jgi:aspartate kinase